MGIHFFLAWKELHDDMVQEKPSGIQKGAKKTSNFRSVKLANVIFCQTSWKFEAIIQRNCLAVFFGDYLATIIPLKKAYFWALQGDVPMKTAERERLQEKGG